MNMDVKTRAEPVTADEIQRLREFAEEGSADFGARKLYRIADALEHGNTLSAAVTAWHAAKLAERAASTASLAAPSDVKLQQAWSDARTAKVVAEGELGKVAESLGEVK